MCKLLALVFIALTFGAGCWPDCEENPKDCPEQVAPGR